jgi:5'-nucleotidase
VLWAIDEGNLDFTPDLVISGINEGQNLGPIIELSGTVGAARTASRLGVPALALSQGLADEPDFEAGVAVALTWLEENFATIRDSEVDAQGLAVAWNINIPTCATGAVRDIIEVPPATNSDVSTSMRS